MSIKSCSHFELYMIKLSALSHLYSISMYVKESKVFWKYNFLTAEDGLVHQNILVNARKLIYSYFSKASKLNELKWLNVCSSFSYI